MQHFGDQKVVVCRAARANLCRPGYVPARGETLIFLVVLIVAVAVLVGWFFFELARLTIGDVRLTRIHEHSLQGVPGGAPTISAGNGRSAEAVSEAAEELEPDGREAPVADEQDAAHGQGLRDMQVLYDEADVEQAVRDRLYGDRMTRAPRK